MRLLLIISSHAWHSSTCADIDQSDAIEQASRRWRDFASMA